MAADSPKRIQLKRTKGWKMPENTVKVTRPGPWGNPFVVNPRFRAGSGSGFYTNVQTVEDAVACFREMFTCDSPEGTRGHWLRTNIHTLRGKNLACFCKIGEPCHGDVLLDLANPALPGDEP